MYRLALATGLAAGTATDKVNQTDMRMQQARVGGAVATNNDPRLMVENQTGALPGVAETRLLRSGTWRADSKGLIVCFDLPKGVSQIQW